MTRAALGDLLKAEARALHDEYRERQSQPPTAPKHSLLDAIIEAIGKGQIRLLQGDVGKVREFFGYIESKQSYLPYLTVR